MAASFNRHTLCLSTNFFFLFLTHSCKPILQTTNLCCCTHSSLPITLISAIFARSHFLTNIQSTTVLFSPDSYVSFLGSFFVNQVFKTTNFIASANSNNISPSVFLSSQPFPPMHTLIAISFRSHMSIDITTNHNKHPVLSRPQSY